MNKKIMLLVGLVLQASLISAQVSIGVKGGLTGCNTRYKDAPSYFKGRTDLRLSYHLGVFSRIALSEKVSLIPELQYISKGFKNKDADYSLRLNYLELPVMISYAPVSLLSIEAGPTVGFKMGAKTKSDAGTNDLSNIYKEDFEFGITGGLRFNLTEKLSVAGRYYHGLSALQEIIFTNEAGEVTGTSSELNYNLQLAVYYVLKQF